jgi:hypothetical protein
VVLDLAAAVGADLHRFADPSYSAGFRVPNGASEARGGGLTAPDGKDEQRKRQAEPNRHVHMTSVTGAT